MTNKLKGLVLALVAAFALSVVVASPASAVSRFTSEETTFVRGIHEGSDVFTTDAGTTTCSFDFYNGSLVFTESFEMEVTPSFGECTAFGFIHVPVDTNSCKFTFTAGGSMHIVCPVGFAIALTAPGCTITIGTQTPTGGSITYTNIGSGTTREITIDLAVTGIHYIEDNNGGGCVGPTGTTKTNGTYAGHSRIEGQNGVHVGIAWDEF